jgi:hypothetical protein
MKRVLLLPADTRPVTLEFPHQLARVAGLEMRSPPLQILNQLNEPGNTAAIAEWLRLEAPRADVAIVSLETLCLGGLIPARRVADSLQEALRRLGVLREIKEQNPGLRILAYGVVVRVAHDNDPMEEKPYYAEWGAGLRRFSEWTDRLERRLAAGQKAHEAQTELDRARLHLPKEVLQDWLGTRERNHALHLAAIDLLNQGVLEYLALTLDQAGPYGLAARDRRKLEARLDELGLWGEADIYPGAEEVALTLLARALINHSGRKTRVLVHYPSVLAERAELLYEDRPLGELVRAHLRAAGCWMVQAAEDADMVLAVNAPATRQAHRQPDFETVDTAERHLPELVDRLVGDQAAGRMMTVADVAYAGGAEHRFVQLLSQSVSLPALAGFAAWGSASNSLGSAIAAGVCALYGDDPVSLAEANFSRLVDDWLYQSRVRWEVHDRLTEELGKPPSPFDLGDLKWGAELAMDQHLTPLAQGLWQQFFASGLPGVRLEWSRPRLAWPRLSTGVFSLRLAREIG